MKEVVIGFLGCGNVGGGVWSLLTGFSREIAHRDSLSIRIKRVLVRDVNKTRACGVPHELLTTNADDVVSDPEISIVVEFMGGEQPATDYMLRALENGKTVVTANKVAIALNWHRLQAAAQRNHVGLYYEASVCGAIPIINTLMQPLQANRIDSLMGIINGTTNYILSRMYENGEDYEAVLHDAQQLGLAEPNPSADVEGLDAAYKLSIMASLAFHARVPFSKVYREGITKITAVDIAYAREMGYVLKLLAIAKRSGNTIEVRVHPTLIANDHPLSQVNGSFNAVYLHGHACKEMMLQGRGAGDLPTASAVVGDILHAATVDVHVHPTLIANDHPLSQVNGSFNAVYLHGHACKEMMLQGRGAGDLPTASAVVGDILHAATVDVHVHPTFVNSANADASLVFTNDWKTRYFLRLSIQDEPGSLAKIATWLSSEQVSIATMMQKAELAGSRVPLIIITHEANEQAIRAALAKFDPEVCTVENMIRVE